MAKPLQAGELQAMLQRLTAGLPSAPAANGTTSPAKIMPVSCSVAAKWSPASTLPTAGSLSSETSAGSVAPLLCDACTAVSPRK